jgi:hypothetical protein
VRLRVCECVCVSLSVPFLSVSLSLWLARNGRANVWRMEIYGALLVQRERCTRRRATGEWSRTGIKGVGGTSYALPNAAASRGVGRGAVISENSKKD